MYVSNRRTDTSLRIIQAFAKSFLENGYTNTSTKKLADELKLSPGNITFYFPAKDDILTIVVDDMIDFGYLFMEREVNEGRSSLLAYCLLTATIAAVCEENEAARDFFLSAYTSETALTQIRERDMKKTKDVFSQYNPDWTDEDWMAIENVVSGIEYATFVTRETVTPLDVQLKNALDSIMFLYRVPADVREDKIKKLLSMDYRTIGREAYADFCTYIAHTHEENIKHHSKYKG